jgi:hypothetical protein
VDGGEEMRRASEVREEGLWNHFRIEGISEDTVRVLRRAFSIGSMLQKETQRPRGLLPLLTFTSASGGRMAIDKAKEASSYPSSVSSFFICHVYQLWSNSRGTHETSAVVLLRSCA